MNLDHPVISAMLPVIFLIFTGFIAGKANLVRGESVRDLTNLVFLVLSQALLFRTMSGVHLERLSLQPCLSYRNCFHLTEALPMPQQPRVTWSLPKGVPRRSFSRRPWPLLEGWVGS